MNESSKNLAIRLYILINAATAVSVLINLLTIPPDPKNAWLLGYSQARVFGATILFLIAGGFVILVIRFWYPESRTLQAVKIIQNHLGSRRLYTIYFDLSRIVFVFSVLSIARFRSYPEYAPNSYLINRLYPFVMWLTVFTLSTNLLLTIMQGKKGNYLARYANPRLWVKFYYSIPLRVRKAIRAAFLKISNVPLENWALGSFLIAFVQFFITKVFLNSEYIMKFPQYIPILDPIGVDLRQYLAFSRSWLESGEYIGNYTPFDNIVFSPLLNLRLPSAYALLTSLTLIAFLATTLLIPNLIQRTRNNMRFATMIFPIGLFSYGLHFELERGQFNLITMAFCMAAIYLFHYKAKYRLIAYVLFSIAIQLKLWPLSLMLMFVSVQNSWGANLRRLFSLMLFNFGLLFILGLQTFKDFIDAAINSTVDPMAWVGNHSIRSYISWRSWQGETSNWWVSFSSEIELLLLAIVALSVIAIVYKNFARGKPGISAPLLLATSVAACLVMPISHDYKLTILAGPIVIYLDNLDLPSDFMRRVGSLILVTLTVYAYSVTQFSSRYKAEIWSNNLPALLAILILVAFIELRGQIPARSVSQNNPD